MTELAVAAIACCTAVKKSAASSNAQVRLLFFKRVTIFAASPVVVPKILKRLLYFSTPMVLSETILALLLSNTIQIPWENKRLYQCFWKLL